MRTLGYGQMCTQNHLYLPVESVLVRLGVARARLDRQQRLQCLVDDRDVLRGGLVLTLEHEQVD